MSLYRMNYDSQTPFLFLVVLMPLPTCPIHTCCISLELHHASDPHKQFPSVTGIWTHNEWQSLQYPRRWPMQCMRSGLCAWGKPHSTYMRQLHCCSIALSRSLEARHYKFVETWSRAESPKAAIRGNPWLSYREWAGQLPPSMGYSMCFGLCINSILMCCLGCHSRVCQCNRDLGSTSQQASASANLEDKGNSSSWPPWGSWPAGLPCCQWRQTCITQEHHQSFLRENMHKPKPICPHTGIPTTPFIHPRFPGFMALVHCRPLPYSSQKAEGSSWYYLPISKHQLIPIQLHMEAHVWYDVIRKPCFSDGCVT